ncbi:lipopolysaccharide biosynthesis protein [Phytopseudomonas dryadis]|uniref:lipopolysaccharide biosynthesis protein n=1 Tax=Phytopseudomonas dryadis TaxID=2487520 RepID=UPI001A955259|nr:hypothetical protein [Pseudomonas dryadis]
MFETALIVRVSNIGLRGATLLSKFALVFFLASFLEPEDLGLYGLLVVAIGYSLYLLGFDFYVFTTRELIGTARAAWGCLLKSQCALSAILYIVFIPLLSLLFASRLLPWSVAAWFFALLILEHLAQELNRLLIAASEQIWASIILFLRSGLWAMLVVALMWAIPACRSLDTVLQWWFFGCALACLVGIAKLFTMRLGGWSSAVDWSWIRKGLKVVLPFLLATLAIRAVFTLDRYAFEYLEGLQALGAYVLFISMCSALLAFLDAGVFAFSYPKLIAHWRSQELRLFSKELKALAIQTLGVSLAFVAASLMVLDSLLGWLDKAVYLDHQRLFYWLLLASTLYGVSMVPHYALYAMGRDKVIIKSHVGSLLLFLISIFLLAKPLQGLAVPVSLCAVFAALTIWKGGALLLMCANRSLVDFSIKE